MKTLYLFRHGKAASQAPSQTDFDRPLVDKGVERTRRMCRMLADRSIRPDLLVSSPAARAIQTARIVADALGVPVEDIVESEWLYSTSAYGYFDIVCKFPQEVGSVMIFAHNEAISQFGNFFLREPIDSLPTSGILALEFPVDSWDQLNHHSRAAEFWTAGPKSVF